MGSGRRGSGRGFAARRPLVSGHLGLRETHLQSISVVKVRGVQEAGGEAWNFPSSLRPGGHLQPSPVPQGQTWFQQRTCPEPGLPAWLPLGHVPDQLLPQEAISEACPSPAMSWEVGTRVLGALDRGRVGKWPPPRGQRGSCLRHTFFGTHYLNPTQLEGTHPSRELWSPHLQAEETALVLPGFGWLGSGQRSTHE